MCFVRVNGGMGLRMMCVVGVVVSVVIDDGKQIARFARNDDDSGDVDGGQHDQHRWVLPEWDLPRPLDRPEIMDTRGTREH